MRDYYVMNMTAYNESFVYYEGNARALLNPSFTIGDFNDNEFEQTFELEDLIKFASYNQVTGIRVKTYTFGAYAVEAVAYTYAFKMLERYIINYAVTCEELDASRAIRQIKVSEDRFIFKWFGVEGSFIGAREKVPVSIADYIINYAEGKDFSPDLSSVACHMESEGVVRYYLKPECKTLLTKLRLLR